MIASVKRLAVAMVLLICLIACGRSPDNPPAGSAPAAPLADLLRKEAVFALEMLPMLLDSMQEGGGFQEWTAAKAIDQLVEIANAAQAPAPDEPKSMTPLRRFVYVKDQASGPWQIVLKLDNEQKGIVATAYGPDAATPLASKSFPVSRY